VELGRSIRGFETQAVDGYRAFWERYAEKLERSAQARLKAESPDEALVLTSAAAHKAHRSVSAGFQDAFVARGYGRLLRTTRSERYFAGLY